MTTTAILRAIPVASEVAICGWLELEAHLSKWPALAPSHRQQVTTDTLMALWSCSQSTVSRRVAAINRAELAMITRANGHQGAWWVQR